MTKITLPDEHTKTIEVTELEYSTLLHELKSNPKNWDGEHWLAPNGKISNLTEWQYVMVRTETFKRWFGDWESAYLVKWAKTIWNNSFASNKKQKSYRHFISKNALDKIRSVIGEEISTLVISPSDIEHIRDSHGNKEELRGQENITAEDIAVIPYIIDNLDSVEPYVNSYGKIVKDKYTISKRINGISYVGTLKVSDKKIKLNTFYITNNKEASHAISLGDNVRNALLSYKKIKEEIQRIKSSIDNSSKIVDENGEPLASGHGR